MVLILLAGARAGHAGETPGQKCTVTKLKAAFKKAGKKGACFEKAIAKAAAVDPTCLGDASAAFGVAFQKAEAKGGCVITGDAMPVEATVDTCVTSVVDEVTGVTTTTMPGTNCPCGLRYLRCGGTCVNTATDPTNCGACGVACRAGLVCLSGICECALGTTFCGSQCNVRPCYCADLLTDPLNCGACGTVCPSTAAICSAGHCTCPTSCGGTCVDTQNDPANCGSCGNVCPPSAPQCAGGACGTTTTTTVPTVGRWHDGDLDTNTQFEWHNSGGSLITLNDYTFRTAYVGAGGGLVVGLFPPGFSILFTDALDAIGYLPAAGPPGPLTSSFVNPLSTVSGDFGGNVLALKLNVDFSGLGLMPGNSGLTLGSLTLCNMSTLPSLDGITVAQVLAIANTLLGGGTASVSITDLDPIIAGINFSFDGGVVSSFAQEHLFNGTCP